MAFIETRLDPCIRYQAQGGPTTSTVVTTVSSGYEQRSSNWSNALSRWDIEYVKGAEGLHELQKFFRAMKGRLHGFRFKDWLDFTVTQQESTFFLHGTNTVGMGGKYSQLAKKYVLSSVGEYRAIKKPVDGTVKFYKNGVLQPSPGTYDATTGVVTWNTTSSRAIFSRTVTGTTLTITTSSGHGFTTGQIVSFTGITGTLGAAINDKPFSVTVTSATEFTIDLPSEGLSGSGGSIVTYPVMTENWTWEGEFDVPVRFDTDTFQAVIAEKDYYEITSLPIVELRI